MSKASLSHEERTAHEPRGRDLHAVRIGRIETVKTDVRVLRLDVQDKAAGIQFLAGQWVDLHVPGIQKAGGFSITSTPTEAEGVAVSDSSNEAGPFVELAVQNSPSSPPAAWLWQSEPSILGSELQMRVGGSFVFPPPGIDLAGIDTVLFVAGGMGINPVVSIMGTMAKKSLSKRVHLMYASKYSGPTLDDCLFGRRLQNIRDNSNGKVELALFLTGRTVQVSQEGNLPGFSRFPIAFSRPTTRDIDQLGLEESNWRKTLCYVCGPPPMADEFYNYIARKPGMASERLICERWW